MTPEHAVAVLLILAAVTVTMLQSFGERRHAAALMRPRH
jgi:hypothetical protein